DEPSSGLDPLMETVFRQLVDEARQAGATVLLSSHILAEVEALADRVTIIRAGRTVESGTLAQLRHLTRTSITVDTEEPIGGLCNLPGVHDCTVDTAHARFQVEPERMNAVLEHLIRFRIRALESSPPTLEQLFLRHYTGDR